MSPGAVQIYFHDHTLVAHANCLGGSKHIQSWSVSWEVDWLPTATGENWSTAMSFREEPLMSIHFWPCDVLAVARQKDQLLAGTIRQQQ